MPVLSNSFLIAAFFVLPSMAHACSDAYVGKEAMLHLPQQTLRGRVDGIDTQGALLFAHGGNTRAYASGELSLREVSA